MRTAWLLLPGLLPACSAPSPAEKAPLSARLARVGLQLVSEDDAGVPASERGRYLPCRVIPRFPRPPLEDHPAGYLIVGVDGRPAPDSRTILRALENWTPGQPLRLTVWRNPYLLAESEFWQADVTLR